MEVCKNRPKQSPQSLWAELFGREIQRDKGRADEVEGGECVTDQRQGRTEVVTLCSIVCCSAV